MNPRRCTSLLLATALWSACSVDQQADQDLWRHQVSLGETPQFTPGQPLPLAAAVRLANEQNEQIAIEGEPLLQAVITRPRITYGLFPSLDIVHT